MAAMAYVYAMQSLEITPVSGYDYLAEFRYGTNGFDCGAPELDAGTDQSQVVASHKWDEDDDAFNGVNSPWKSMSLTLMSGSNGLSWGDSSTPNQMTFSTAFAAIEKVEIRSGAQIDGAAGWRNLNLVFYKNGIQTEVVNLGSNPILADARGSQPGTVSQHLLRIQPAQSDNDKVVITGEISLMSAEGWWPAENDLFGQVFLYTRTAQELGLSVPPLTQAATSPSATFSTALLNSEESVLETLTEPAAMLA